jgi:LDH2 family malate/lactate/ureidoglycolate dehydrogenase
VNPSADITVVRETASTALIDGGNGFGQVACEAAMKMAIEKAENTVISAVGLFRSFHIGRLADYAEMAAKRGMIGVVACNSVPWVAPWGGRQRLLGTNPICFAIPSGQGRPILVDVSTSASSEGKVRVKRARREALPEGWILDKKGQRSTNPSDLYEGGALLPMGAHKGFSLALVIDILAGALTIGQINGEVPRPFNNVFLEAIKIEGFRALKDFEATVDRLLKRLKACPPAAGFEMVVIPGDPESEVREKRLKEGISIEDSTWEEIKSLCGESGVDCPS